MSASCRASRAHDVVDYCEEVGVSGGAVALAKIGSSALGDELIAPAHALGRE